MKVGALNRELALGNAPNRWIATLWCLTYRLAKHGGKNRFEDSLSRRALVSTQVLRSQICRWQTNLAPLAPNLLGGRAVLIYPPFQGGSGCKPGRINEPSPAEGTDA